MEIEVAGKGLKRLRKGTKRASSLVAKDGPANRFGAQAKEAKYAPENWIDVGRLALEFPATRDKVRELGLGYIFVEPYECNLTL
ncbi:hypothetical protein HAX54_001872, partial [Datura stramonium]|nr:hypothetical protein [Datura stramonium]